MVNLEELQGSVAAWEWSGFHVRNWLCGLFNRKYVQNITNKYATPSQRRLLQRCRLDSDTQARLFLEAHTTAFIANNVSELCALPIGWNIEYSIEAGLGSPPLKLFCVPLSMLWVAGAFHSRQCMLSVLSAGKFRNTSLWRSLVFGRPPACEWFWVACFNMIIPIHNDNISFINIIIIIIVFVSL